MLGCEGERRLIGMVRKWVILPSCSSGIWTAKLYAAFPTGGT